MQSAVMWRNVVPVPLFAVAIGASRVRITFVRWFLGNFRAEDLVN
jgi:hypothetical protein